MLALYRDGRQAGALAAYRATLGPRTGAVLVRASRRRSR
jgi:hypothetical protein